MSNAYVTEIWEYVYQRSSVMTVEKIYPSSIILFTNIHANLYKTDAKCLEKCLFSDALQLLLVFILWQKFRFYTEKIPLNLHTEIFENNTP